MQTEQVTRQGSPLDREGQQRWIQPNGLETRARGLGWFSLALGLSQLIAPRAVARLIGAPVHGRTRGTLLALGLREITSGLGILSRPRPAGWVWSRVAGDVMDLALLGAVFRSQQAERRRAQQRTMGAVAAVLGVAVLDTISAVQLTKKRREARAASRPGFHVTRVVTINRSPEEVYRFWRNFENLPRFTAHLESVRVNDGISIWRAKGPAGTNVEWEAEVTTDVPNEMIAWRSRGTSVVPNQGAVRFRQAPGNRGTEVIVDLNYRPPAGSLGVTIAKMFGEEPGQQIEADLRRLKQVLETGEVVHSDASIHKGMHSARPATDKEFLKGGYFK